jgi:hypothetical protein
VNPECKCRRVGPLPINIGVRGYGKLTISMAECEGLALVTLAKMENDQVNKGELARVATLLDLDVSHSKICYKLYVLITKFHVAN